MISVANHSDFATPSGTKHLFEYRNEGDELMNDNS